MRKFATLCTLLALSVALVGCGSKNDNKPGLPQVTVQRVDPLAPVPGQPQAQADPGAEVSLTRNFYIVFDGSGSMSGNRLKRAKAATKQFLQGLPADVNIGLYVFDWNGSSERVKLGPKNHAAAEAVVDGISASGGTPLGASIREGTNALVAQYKKQLGYGDYRLIVITDGEPSDLDDMKAAVLEAAKFGMPICTIGIDIGEGHPLRAGSLSYKDTQNVADLADALKEATGELEAFDADSFKK